MKKYQKKFVNITNEVKLNNDDHKYPNLEHIKTSGDAFIKQIRLLKSLKTIDIEGWNAVTAALNDVSGEIHYQQLWINDLRKNTFSTKD